MTTPGPENYKELLLFLATAGVIVPLFGRLKVSPVFGFLAAGIVLGPFGLGALAKDVSLALGRLHNRCRTDRPHRRIRCRISFVHDCA
jgi:hypothetical protein